MDDPSSRPTKKPAIFLEGDGTLNVDCPYCRSPDQITLYDVFGPLKELSKDYLIIVVSNQSGVARGYYTEDEVKAVNEKVRREVEKRGEVGSTPSTTALTSQKRGAPAGSRRPA